MNLKNTKTPLIYDYVKIIEINVKEKSNYNKFYDVKNLKKEKFYKAIVKI